MPEQNSYQNTATTGSDVYAQVNKGDRACPAGSAQASAGSDVYAQVQKQPKGDNLQKQPKGDNSQKQPKGNNPKKKVKKEKPKPTDNGKQWLFYLLFFLTNNKYL
jgi:hypothetical protein